jgi:O-acetylhomoserine/O-acetylserine sulfhydrylase-like pyridoxal-dependent enzyme
MIDLNTYINNSNLDAEKHSQLIRIRKSMCFDTISTHGVYDLHEAMKNQGSIIEPIFMSTAQAFKDANELEASLSYQIPSWSYSRIHNPTLYYLESTLSLLEGYRSNINTNCCVTSSGMSAITLAIENLLSHDNSNFISTSSVYGGTFQQFSIQQKNKNNIVRWVDNDANIDLWESHIDCNTRFIYVEMPTNPLLKTSNITELSLLAHKHEIPLIVDSTLATPALLRPIELGADIVIHSLSKTIASSGLAIGGAIIAKENITSKFLPIEIKQNFTQYLKLLPNRDNGACLSPMQALLILSDLRTLRSRVKHLSESTETIIAFLMQHEKVGTIYYPKYSSDKHSSIFTLVDTNIKLYGHVLSFTINGNLNQTKKVLSNLQLIYRATDLGRIKSVATIPSISTHLQQGKIGQKLASIPQNLIRLSVGSEDPIDIINDLDVALKGI